MESKIRSSIYGARPTGIKRKLKKAAPKNRNAEEIMGDSVTVNEAFSMESTGRISKGAPFLV